MIVNPTTAASSAANHREKLRREGTLSPATLRDAATKARSLGSTSGGLAEHYAALAEAFEAEAVQLERELAGASA